MSKYELNFDKIDWSKGSPYTPPTAVKLDVRVPSVSVSDLCERCGVSDVWTDIDIDPIRIKSKKHLRDECRARGLTSKFLDY